MDAYEQKSADEIIGLNNKLLRLADVPVTASIMAGLVAKSRGPPGNEKGSLLPFNSCRCCPLISDSESSSKTTSPITSMKRRLL